MANKKPDEVSSEKNVTDQEQKPQNEAESDQKLPNGNERAESDGQVQSEKGAPSGEQKDGEDPASQNGSEPANPDQKNPEAPGDDKLNNGLAKSGKSTAIIEEVYTGTAEKTYTESAYHPDSLRRPYNPDKLVMKDWTYRIYEEMLEDDQISVALQIKKDLVIGNGYYFETEAEGQEDIQKDLEIAFNEQTDRPFTSILEDILQAYEFGFSVSEKIFKDRGDGTICLKDCKPRHPSTWLLWTDEQGNMTRYEQRAKERSVDADPMSIIHYVNNQRHQNPYGRSDLFPAYQAYMTKRHITRFYAIYLEKAASPIPVGKYDRRAPQEAIDNIYEALKKFQTKTTLVIPKEFEMEFLEAKNNGEAFIKGINLFNMFIGRALFIPDLVGFQGSETGGGSYALGKDQIGLFFRHIYRRREILERIVNMHFVRPICTYNYGMLEDFPKFKLNPLSDEDGRAQCELWIKAMQGKNWTPTPEEINHFRNLIKFPQSEIVDLPLPIDPLTGQPIQPDPNADPEVDPETGKPLDPAAGDPELDQEGGDDEEGTGGAAGPGVGKGAPGDKGAQKPPAGKGQKVPAKKAPSEGDPEAKEVVKKKFAYDLSSLKGMYHYKCDFAAMDKAMDNTVGNILAEAQPVVDDIFENLFDQLQKKKIIQNQDLESVDKIKLKDLKPLQIIFKKHFRRMFVEGESAAAREISPVQFAKKPIPHDEFLDFLDQETYRYIGDWQYSVMRKVKDELTAAIKDGKPLASVIGVMDDEGKKLSAVSLERFARTKTTEVFNKGRLAYFESTGVVEAYQYSAILDDRTSYICEGLHGKIFKSGEQPTPPMHFNCRSVLIPITKYENYEVDGESNFGDNIDSFIDEEKGQGFPRN